MPRDQQTIFPISGMDQDSDLSKIVEGDYISAKNIRQLTDSGQTTHSVEPTKGNQRSYTIPPATAQNKKYRFTNIPIGSQFLFSQPWTLTLTFADGTIKQQDLQGDFYNELNDFADWLKGALADALITNITTSTGTDYVDVDLEIQGALGNEYTLEVSTNDIEIALVAEAIPANLAGEMTEINGYDLNGNLFVWSTRSSTETEQVLSLSLYHLTANEIAFTTIPDHGLWTGQQIKIEGATKQPTANGTWTIIVQLGNRILLKDSTAGPAFTGAETGTITLLLSPGNLSEIGVATHEINGDAWTYTRLIRTKDWNFNVLKKPNIHMEQNNIELWLGWTDNFNVPRVFYYSGDFITDGSIEGLNDAGKYTYEFLEEETRLFLGNSKIKFEFTGQDQSGGNVHSGNHRYSVRLLTENKTPTDYLDLGNPISVFIATASSANPKLIFGDKHIATPKINNFTVSDIPPGLFSFIELVVVEYDEDAISGQTIIRETIGTDQTSINLQHTGNETTTPLVLGTLNEKNVNYSTAKNMTAIDNRLLLSNLTQSQVHDFREWAASFKHTLKQKTLPSVGDIGVDFGEYQDPNNVHNFMGYMYNETYRFSMKGRLKTGGYTQNFWIDDIKFNTDPATPDGRRLGSFTNYDLTNSGVSPNEAIPTEIKVPYVEFDRPDFDFIIDGLKVSELIDQVIIERAEVVPEVLATGAMVMGLKYDPAQNTYYFDTKDSNIKGNYPLVSSTPQNNDSYNSNVIALTFNSNVKIDPDRKWGTLYSPDIFYNHISISFKSNDKILNFGGLDDENKSHSVAFSTTNTLANWYKQFWGKMEDFDTIDINESKMLERDTTIDIFGKKYSSKIFFSGMDSAQNDILYKWEMEKGLVINTSTDVAYKSNIGVTGDEGLRYVQYFREKTNKYGDKTKTQYIPTGTTYDIASSGVIKVFGGDTFTQKTYFKYNYDTDSLTKSDGTKFASGGVGAIIFYSQNRVNTQMRSLDGVTTDNDFPKTDGTTWLRQQSSPDFKYNRGYNIKNGINADRAFDPSLKLQSDLPVRIIYSAIKPQNSLVDAYREFQALNFKDLDLSFGEIVHMANGNNELIAWQRRAFKLLIFNTRNVLISTDGTELIIGTGAVMAGDDRILSAYGCNNKWSIIEGKSQEGNKMFAWINTEFKKVIRYSYDGTRSLEYIKKMRSFFNNNLDWVKNKDTPVGGEGIHGVWDDEFNELIWTVNGKRVVTSMEPVSQQFGEFGEVFTVFFPEGTAFSYQDEIYEAKTGATNINFPLSSFWSVVPHDNPKYYNEYTIAYNEIKNRFTTFFSFLPKLYLRWENTYHSPMYITNETGKTFIHNKGGYCSWYGGALEVDGFIEGVINKYSDEKKNYAAMRSISDIAPERIDFTTKTQKSFLTSSEFETREDEHDSSIKEDSTATGLNDGDTGLLFGKYLKVKFVFKKKTYQKLNDLIIKFRIKARLSVK